MDRLLILLLIATAAVFLIRFVVFNRPASGGAVYDERQIAARGRAGEAAFLTLLLYNMLGAVLVCIFRWSWIDNAVIFGFLGATLAMFVWVELLIWSNAYKPVGEKPLRGIVGSLLDGALCLAAFAVNVRFGEPLVKDGRLQIFVLLLPFGVMSVLTDATLILRHWLDQRSKEAEEA